MAKNLYFFFLFFFLLALFFRALSRSSRLFLELFNFFFTHAFEINVELNVWVLILLIEVCALAELGLALPSIH